MKFGQTLAHELFRFAIGKKYPRAIPGKARKAHDARNYRKAGVCLPLHNLLSGQTLQKAVCVRFLRIICLPQFIIMQLPSWLGKLVCSNLRTVLESGRLWAIGLELELTREIIPEREYYSGRRQILYQNCLNLFGTILLFV